MVLQMPARRLPNDYDELDLTKVVGTVLVETVRGTYTVQRTQTPDDGFAISRMAYIEIDFDGDAPEGRFPMVCHAHGIVHRGRTWPFDVPRDGVPTRDGTSAEVLKISKEV